MQPATDNVLTDVVQRLTAEPHSGQSLLLYGLLKSLSTEQGGHMYMLRKLRDFDPLHRQLAYGLIELMARGANQGPEWAAAIAAIDEAMRAKY